MYTLYKNPIQLETLYIVQYLHYNNIKLLPNIIIERNFPSFITELPTIVYDNNIYSGIDNVISFYEKNTNIDNLYEKSLEFKIKNPEYTIH